MSCRRSSRGADPRSEVPSVGAWSGSGRPQQPAQAPRLSHWSKYDTVGSTEPVRGDASVRGRRRNRDAGRADDYSEELVSAGDAAPAPAKGTFISNPPYICMHMIACT